MTSSAAARVAIALAVLLWSAAGIAATRDDDFLAARDAFRVGDARKLDHYAHRLQGYVLEPYVAHWQLRLKLNDATPDEIHAFLDRYAGTSVAERLRTEWLKRLGQDQQWDLFDAELGNTGADDVELTC